MVVRPNRAVRLLIVALLAVPAMLSSGPVAAQTDDGYAEWTVTGPGGAITGTMTLPPGFPGATFTSDSLAPVAIGDGDATWIPEGSAFGAVYGSSETRPYLDLRPAADSAGAPSTTTYTFASPTPPGGWGFVLSDIDSDAVTVTATDAAGAAVPLAGLGFEGVFNYCDATPSGDSCAGVVAPFDVPVVTSDATSVTLTGNGVDTEGAAGWFQPTVPISTLTFVFTWQSGAPIFHTHFASLTRTVSGTVTLDGEPGVAGAEVTLTDGAGTAVVTTSTDDDGGYLLTGLGPVDGLTVSVALPVQYVAAGPTEQTVDLAAGDASDVDFDATAALRSISGTVTLDGGTGPEGVELTLLEGDVAVATTVTDEEGTYLFEDIIAAAGYSVAIAAPPQYAVEPPASRDVDLTAADATGVDFALTVPRYELTGEVVNTAGAPIVGVTVNLEQLDGSLMMSVLTGADGRYEMSGIPAGTYRLRFIPPSGYLSSSLEISVPVPGGEVPAVTLATAAQPTTTTTTTTTFVTTTTTTGTLPVTGSPTGDVTLIGLVLLFSGLLLLGVARLRRT